MSSNFARINEFQYVFVHWTIAEKKIQLLFNFQGYFCVRSSTMQEKRKTSVTQKHFVMEK